MDIQLRATITRNSNGSVDLQPIAGEANPFNIDRLTLHISGTPSEKDFPVDSEATIALSSGTRRVDLVNDAPASAAPAATTERRAKK